MSNYVSNCIDGLSDIQINNLQGPQLAYLDDIIGNLFSFLLILASKPIWEKGVVEVLNLVSTYFVMEYK